MIALGLAAALAEPTASFAKQRRVPYHDVAAATIARKLAAGIPVTETRATIRGPLHLPAEIGTALAIRDSRILGPVLGANCEFRRLVDFSNTRFRRRIDFEDASFQGPAIWQGAATGPHVRSTFANASFAASAIFRKTVFRAAVSFVDARFQSEAQFPLASFADSANFNLASFARPVTFSSRTFEGKAWFNDAEFDSAADFSFAEFDGTSSFVRARFAAAPDFTRTTFVTASFPFARFDAGAVFARARFTSDADFSSARASGDLTFDAARFETGGNFDSSVLLRDATFRAARINGEVTFDQASIGTLDLREAVLGGKVLLPDSGPGRFRLDLGDSPRIEASQSGRQVRAEERALRWVADTAKADDNLKTENQARIRRYSLERDELPFVPRILDWVFWWGLLGYLLQPVHPLIAIGVVLLIGVIAGFLSSSAKGPRRVWEAFRDSLASLKLKPPKSGWRQVEYAVLKVLTVVLIVNVGNVWPAFHDLVQGVL